MSKDISVKLATKIQKVAEDLKRVISSMEGFIFRIQMIGRPVTF